MDKAIKIIESEIAQRETANQIKSNLRFEVIKEEINQLKEVLELVNKTNDIHDVSNCLRCEPMEYYAENIRYFKCKHCGKEMK